MENNKALIIDLKEIISHSKKKAYTSVNFLMVESYWNIGRRIVEEEQGGKRKAGYGDALLKFLSQELCREFGSGYSETNLKYFRGFYLAFPIRHTVCDELGNEQNQLVAKKLPLFCKLPSILRPELSWSHYRLIMRVEGLQAKQYYIEEAANEAWSVRNLERNINTLYYERILSSKDKTIPRAEANDESRLDSKQEQDLNHKPNIRDFIKDPFVLEFLDLPTNASYKEKDLENALISHLQSFLLELGKGFAFIARQKHIRTEHSDFFIDLVFYNYELKCFVLLDLKTTKLSHQDIGQMDMYVRMYDDLKRGKDDNPTIGVVLCSEQDSVIAKYSVLKGSEQLFSSKYSAVLPSEEELKAEIERGIEDIQAQIRED